MFHVICLATGKPLTDHDDAPIVYDEGRCAANVAKSMTETTGTTYQPRRVATVADTEWRTREQGRMVSGEYLAVLPSLQVHLVPDHYAHVSKDKSHLIAYTPDEAHGIRDAQKRISVATYLERYAPDVSPDDRDALVSEHTEHFATLELLFATSADDIERVYTKYDRNSDGLGVSCMRYTSWDYAPEHPTRAYAGHGLAIAYTKNESGETTSRALCWSERKVYSRVYGDGNLHNLLRLKGYAKCTEYYRDGERDFNGAKLSAIPHPDYDDCYLMPYIDGVSRVTKRGRTFVIGDEWGEYDSNNTNGLTRDVENEDTNSDYCSHCDESVPEGETRMVYTREGQREEEHWCEHCRSRDAFFCNGTEEYYADHVGYVEVDGETYSQEYASDHFTYCDCSGEYTSGDVVSVIVDTRGNEETWCTDSAESDAFKCLYDGKWYSRDLMSLTKYVADCNEEEYLAGKLSANPSEDQLSLALSE